MSIYEELRALDDLDEPRSLRFGSTGLRLWPYVRWIAFCAAADRVLGLTPAFASDDVRGLRQRAELVLRTALRGPLSVRRRFDIAMVASSAGSFERDGCWFDRINDYFALEAPDRTLVLDRAINGRYRTPRVPPHVRCYDTFELRASIEARLRRPHDADLAAIDHLLAFVRARFPVALEGATIDQLRTQLLYWALRVPLLRDSFARFFDRVRPRLLVIEDSSYGAYAHVNTWARTAGVETAELQHGVISRSHLAYNYGDAARGDRELADSLPQHLLLYGELWRDEVRTTSDVVIAGCPHFAEARTTASAAPSNVLVISQGIVTDQLVRITAMLAARFPDQRFVFRLHPGEVAFRERYAPLEPIANVQIDSGGDLYTRLAAARVAIGHSSTALVEAAGTGVPVFVLDDPAARAIMPAGVGSWFRSVDELAPMLEAPPALATDVERFFATDWRERYRAFIARVAS